MPYRHVLTRLDYTHYASGHVLANLPGQPAFPARLASEVFLRLLELRQKAGWLNPPHLVDPCCGGAYHLALLGLLHRTQLASLTASDIDPRALDIARRNLACLSSAGLQARLAQIQSMQAEFGKPSHAAALHSAQLLLQAVQAQETAHPLPVHLFQADAFDPQALQAGLAGQPVDLVFSDLPYGQHSQWQGLAAQAADPPDRLLEALAQVLKPGVLLALATPKDTRPAHPAYAPLGRLKLGKRLISFLKRN